MRKIRCFLRISWADGLSFFLIHYLQETNYVLSADCIRILRLQFYIQNDIKNIIHNLEDNNSFIKLKSKWQSHGNYKLLHVFMDRYKKKVMIQFGAPSLSSLISYSLFEQSTQTNSIAWNRKIIVVSRESPFSVFNYWECNNGKCWKIVSVRYVLLWCFWR